MEEELVSRLKSILIDKLGVDNNKINMNARLAEDLGIDSFAGAELIFMLEDEFNIKIPDTEMVKLKTVEDAIKAIRQKIK